jgi:uncharacterized protein YndB with AHSA1/START domain
VPAPYRFLDRWHVPAPIEEVYDLLGDLRSYPSWWSKNWLEVTGDDGPPRPGKRNDVVVRGFLPYNVRFALEVVEAERPRRILSRLEGEFEGSGEWRLDSEGDGTRAELDWRPLVAKPLVRNLTPILRPLFEANHNWTMRQGQQAVLDEVRRRRAA